jgi:hypothetical protein
MPAVAPLKAVARMLDVPERNLYARAREGLITVEPRPSGRVRVLADPDVCRREVAELRCQAPGCDQPAHRAGRFCSHACSVRKYAPEIRRCKGCDEPFRAEGHRTRDRDGLGQEFCSPKCIIDWRWEHEPETFPQSQLRGAEKRCPICGSTRYRPPSHQHLECCSAECAHEAWRRWHDTPTGARWQAGSWIKGRHGDAASVGAYGRLASQINKAGPKPKLASEEDALIWEMRANGKTLGQIVIEGRRLINEDLTLKQVRGALARRGG